jgi:hypothetical protein
MSAGSVLDIGASVQGKDRRQIWSGTGADQFIECMASMIIISGLAVHIAIIAAM